VIEKFLTIDPKGLELLAEKAMEDVLCFVLSIWQVFAEL
jgi:hypothetical protein